jgi:hypothetical protein
MCAQGDRGMDDKQVYETVLDGDESMEKIKQNHGT